MFLYQSDHGVTYMKPISPVHRVFGTFLNIRELFGRFGEHFGEVVGEIFGTFGRGLGD